MNDTYDPPIGGKLYQTGRGNGRCHREFQCMWKGCHYEARHELAKSNTPSRLNGYKDWWCFCSSHHERAMGLRREVLVAFVDSIRLQRHVDQVEFKP